jgi:dihydroorotase
MRILLYGGKIVTPEKTYIGNLVINRTKIEKIEQISKKINFSGEFDVKIDCSNMFILPGIIDPHVHLRDMDQSYKETIKTGSLAAIKGGITTILSMPNTIPKLSSVKTLKKYREIIKNKAYSNIGIFGGISDSFNLDTLKNMKELGIFGLKIYPGDTSSSFELNWEPFIHIEHEMSLNVPDYKINVPKIVDFIENYFKSDKETLQIKMANWIKLFETINGLDLPLLFHPDLPISKNIRKKVFIQYKENENSHLKAFSCTYSKKDELVHIATIFIILKLMSEKQKLLKKPSFPTLIFCHVSCPESIELIESLKNHLDLEELNKNIKIEVTPHHLFLDNGLILQNPSHGKVLMPLRSKNDVLGLQRAVQHNKISFFGTDHAPHTLKDKNKSFFEAPSGFPGLDTYILFVLTQVFKNFITIEKFSEYSSSNPSEIYGLKNKGKIKPGYDADLIIIEKTEPYKLKIENFSSKSHVCPYNLDNIEVRIHSVFLGGKLVVDSNSILEKENKIYYGNLLLK